MAIVLILSSISIGIFTQETDIYSINTKIEEIPSIDSQNTEELFGTLVEDSAQITRSPSADETILSVENSNNTSTSSSLSESLISDMEVTNSEITTTAITENSIMETEKTSETLTEATSSVSLSESSPSTNYKPQNLRNSVVPMANGGVINIGDVEFNDLQEAINAAEINDTLQLSGGDLIITSTIRFPSEKN